jgi:GlpG protein
MIKALSVSAEENLQPLSQYLNAQGVRHRISEQAHRQILWVAHESDVALAEWAYQAARNGDLPRPASSVQPWSAGKHGSEANRVMAALLEVPVTSLMIVISLVSTALLYTGFGENVFDLLRMGTWSYMFESGQLWRLITPVFLHFSLMHIAFNMVMLWYFGRQLEKREGYGTLLLLLLLFTTVPNVAQSLAEGIRFGGMSGVVYALLGYCWLTNRLSGRMLYIFPGAIMGLMVAWLVIGFSGILTHVGFPPMANVAHLGGLLIGLACAFCMSKIRTK